jgi:hypothetical protein
MVEVHLHCKMATILSATNTGRRSLPEGAHSSKGSPPKPASAIQINRVSGDRLVTPSCSVLAPSVVISRQKESEEQNGYHTIEIHMNLVMTERELDAD